MQRNRTGHRGALLGVRAVIVVLAVVLGGCSTSSSPLPGDAGGAASASIASPKGHGPSAVVGAALPSLPSPLRVVGIGDSVTAASRCGCQGFVADYGRLLHRRLGLPVDAVEYGVSGATTQSMLTQLQGSGIPARSLASADVISVTIGANDLESARAAYDAGSCRGPTNLACFTPAVAAMRAGLARDLAAIDRLTRGRQVQILVNNYWNVFEDGQVALRENGRRYLADSDTMTRLANRAICAAATSAGAVCVDTYTPYKGEDGGKDPTELLADDGNHPNRAGHLVIAEAMLSAGLPALGN